MEVTDLFHRIQVDLLLHGEQYGFVIKAVTVAVLCYVGVTDLRTFKIQNESVLLLAALYLLYALIFRSWYEVLSNVILAVAVLSLLLWFYTRGVLGGGDVKLLPVACLWVGSHCALLFSMLLFVLIVFHLVIVRLGWARTRIVRGRHAIPYGPSVVGAMIGGILLGCL
jgi:prepilin peptidase CpaA